MVNLETFGDYIFGRKNQDQSFYLVRKSLPLILTISTLPKTNSWHLKIDLPKRKIDLFNRHFPGANILLLGSGFFWFPQHLSGQQKTATKRLVGHLKWSLEGNLPPKNVCKNSGLGFFSVISIPCPDFFQGKPTKLFLGKNPLLVFGNQPMVGKPTNQPGCHQPFEIRGPLRRGEKFDLGLWEPQCPSCIETNQPGFSNANK